MLETYSLKYQNTIFLYNPINISLVKKDSTCWSQAQTGSVQVVVLINKITYVTHL